MTDVEIINQRLLSFGKTLNNRPKWRVVWSDDQLEKRTGIFNEFVTGIFIRTKVGTFEVPKYPYIKERWILERYVPPEYSYNPEIPDSRNGSYEPLFPFEDGDGNPLPLNIKACEFIVRMAESPRSKMNENEIKAHLEKKEALEVEEILQSLGE